ncbi:hypothetical protein MTP99_018508 [Tenebrio molitor]|uniref:QRFP-like peptide receptor n=1 Tax=Tenebrio molitor TaxID=7067 RepID=UPI0026F5A165|nr:hypothetical protein MTP99_018508 [Tenebrio molitor]
MPLIAFNSDTISNNSSNVTKYNAYVLFSDHVRIVFLSIFVVVTAVSLGGNFAAIYSTTKRNYRYLQKTCIISLALSDILGTVAIAAINMVDLAQDVMVWPLGDFLCRFLPMCQMTGILASSFALVFIAIDRYRNVVHALSKRWNPRLCFCLGGAAILWLASFGISYPIYHYFWYFPLKVVNENEELETIYVCMMMVKKETQRDYYLYMVIIIFLPLFFVFMWFYYKIALLIWKHRKPLSIKFNNKSQAENSSSTSRNFSEVKDPKKPKTQDEIRMERKIRTFKIIIVLMVVFIACRFPYFGIQIYKSVHSTDICMETLWYLSFSFMALHIVNCFLNPLLYTFLNFTLQIWFKVKRSLRCLLLEICCTSEFENFEKENPFVIEDYEKNKKSWKVRFEDQKRY